MLRQVWIFTLIQVVDGFVMISFSVTLATFHSTSARSATGLLNYARELLPLPHAIRKREGSTESLTSQRITDIVLWREFLSPLQALPG